MPFKPGNTLGGKIAGISYIRKLARAHTEEALKILVKHMGNDDGRIAVAAATAVLDRGYGKPTQPIGGDEESSPIRVDTSEGVLALLKRLAGDSDAS